MAKYLRDCWYNSKEIVEGVPKKVCGFKFLKNISEEELVKVISEILLV